MRLRQELGQYDPFEIIEGYLAATLPDAWARRELTDAGGHRERSDGASAGPA